VLNSLRHLCGLGVSAVFLFKPSHRRDAKYAEVAQRVELIRTNTLFCETDHPTDTTKSEIRNPKSEIALVAPSLHEGEGTVADGELEECTTGARACADHSLRNPRLHARNQPAKVIDDLP
jgi:hypothetical protein